MSPVERFPWRVAFRVDKFAGVDLAAAGLFHKPAARELDALVAIGLIRPVEVRHGEGNLVVDEGGALLWQHALGNGTATADQDLTYLDNGNAHLGVGNGVTAAAASDTDLAGASKDFQPMEAGYPQVSALEATFRSVWGSTEGNFAWEEWCVANAVAPGTAGRILNRKVEALGTKSAGATWTLTVTLSY